MGNVEDAKEDFNRAVTEREIIKSQLDRADRYVAAATGYLIELLSR